jgi:hypothetical protein
MSVVVLVAGVCLAVLAEVCVVTDSTLVAYSLDIGKVLLARAKRSIAVDAVMAVGATQRLG